jgi:RimJ/RimL family protein N-acetyltransferase
MGGDPQQATQEFVRQVISQPNVSGYGFEVLDGQRDVGRVAQRATVALAASGSTAWELCALGIPTVFFAVAENQVAVGQEIEEAGAGVYVGDPGSADPRQAADRLARLLVDPSRRAQITMAATSMVDGRGAARVVTRMWSHLLEIREATGADVDLLWRWTSDPQVRRNSFSPEPIPFDAHVKWFETLLEDPKRHQFVAYLASADGASPVGQIRFDECDDMSDDLGDTATIHVSVAARYRGAGWGGPIIDAAVKTFFGKYQVGRVMAHIKESNLPSVRAFVYADFDPLNQAEAGVGTYVRLREGNICSE